MASTADHRFECVRQGANTVKGTRAWQRQTLGQSPQRTLERIAVLPNLWIPHGALPDKEKSKVYRYYVCQTAIKRGHNQCRTGSIPAPPIEAAVVESLRCIVDDEGVRRAVFEQSEQLLQQHQQRQDLQLRQLTSQRSRDEAELKRMSTEGEAGDLNDTRRRDLKVRLAKTQARIVEVEKDLEHLKQCRFGRSDVEEAVSDFDQLWAILHPKERVQLMELLVSRIQYDRFEGDLSISFHPTAISVLIQNDEEAA